MQLPVKSNLEPYLIAPDPGAVRLTRAVTGMDHTGQQTTINVVEERPLTIFLNAQEIVTAMTIGDYPEYLALGFLRNQGMLMADDESKKVEYDDDLEVVIVRTARKTNYEEKMRKKTRTSGCAVGTVFGDMRGWRGSRCPHRVCILRGSMPSAHRSIAHQASIWKRAPSTVLSCAKGISHWSIWRMWVVIMQWTRLLAG